MPHLSNVRPRSGRRRSRLGRRGGVLLDLGFMWIVTGISIAFTGGVVGRPPAPHEMLPSLLREGAWLVTGLVAVAAAFHRQPGRDRWGFVALVVMPAERAASWTVAALIGMSGYLPEPFDLTDWLPMPSLTLSVSGALVWIAVTRLILRIAGWKENDLPADLGVK